MKSNGKKLFQHFEESELRLLITAATEASLSLLSFHFDATRI